ncbi:hypothetical protein MMC29_000905 [Sticta canariensis]|nr:hypothetical protein [Sticta canariensis]
MDSHSICATKPGAKVSDSSTLEAGFPPTHMPDETYPLCQIKYTIPAGWGPWAEVRFDVDDLCLKGMKGEQIACCDRNEIYKGSVIPSPYFIKNEGSSQTDGSHSTSWDDAFPSALKSLKESKYSMYSLPPYNDAFAFDSFSPQRLPTSWDNVKLNQQTEPLANFNNVNVASTGSILNLDDLLALNSGAQPVIPENFYEQNNDVGEGSTHLFASTISSELTALEPEE